MVNYLYYHGRVLCPIGPVPVGIRKSSYERMYDVSSRELKRICKERGVLEIAGSAGNISGVRGLISAIASVNRIED